MSAGAQIDPSDALATRIEQWVRQRHVTAGTRLPSGRAFMRQFEQSFAVTQAAVLKLVARGVFRRDGYRLYLADAPSPTSPTPAIVHLLTHFGPLVAAMRRASRDLGARIATRRINTLASPLARERLAASFVGPLIWAGGTPPAALSRRREPTITIGAQIDGVDSVTTSPFDLERLALAELTRRGHRRVVYLTSRTLGWGDDAWLGSLVQIASRDFGVTLTIARADSSFRDQLLAAWRRANAPAVPHTALMVWQSEPAHEVAVRLRREGVRIPHDLSIIACADSHDARERSGDITHVRDDWSTLASVALGMLLRPRRANQVPARVPARVSAAPLLIDRGSIADLNVADRSQLAEPRNETEAAGASDGRVRTPGAAAASAMRWPGGPQARRDAVLRFNAVRHRLADADPSASRWHPIDLSRHVNRTIGLPNSWGSGEGLHHLRGGRRDLHGVPYELVDAPAKASCRAVVFASAGGGRRRLPTLLELKLPRISAAALYVLHAVRYANGTPFGDCVLQGEHGSHTVSFVSLGNAPSSAVEARPTVQDWWPGFPVLEDVASLPVVVTRDQDPLLFERYLYSLEIGVNQSIGHLVGATFRVGADHATKLAIFGVSLLANRAS